MENRIRETRLAHGMTMKQLGLEIGVAESTISQYERGKRQPDNEVLLRLSDLFGVTVGYLLGAEGPKTSRDILDEVDISFYDGYKELDERDQETVRDMVRVMRSKNKKQE